MASIEPCPPEVPSFSVLFEGGLQMMVIGIDPHKRTFTAGGVDGVTGRARAVQTGGPDSFERLLRWARELDEQRVWAIEDVRHVSGRLERWLLARGERVVRVAPKLMVGARRSARTRGKSDEIDALAVARAAIREGLQTLPIAALEGVALEIRLLADHREDLVAQRTAAAQRLRWHLHDLDAPMEVPPGALDRAKWRSRVQAFLESLDDGVRRTIALELLEQIQVLTPRIRDLERDLAERVAQVAPQLLAEPGCGPLTAAKLIGETAGIERFRNDACFARAAGVAPIPASSGNTTRHRLDPGGNRQLNCGLHRLAVNKAKWDPATAAYLARRQAEGKTRKEALRCLKRHLARRVWRLLQNTTAPLPPTGTFHC